MGHDEVDKVLVVTGGGGAIGRAIAVRAVRRGIPVALVDDDLEAAQASLTYLVKAGGCGLAVKADVSDATAVAAAFDRIESQLGPVHTLVNAAGIVRGATTIGVPEEDWRQVLEVNLSGTFFTCQAALKRMQARGQGAIVNVASVHGLLGMAGRAAYAASKGGIISLTRALAAEFGPYGIRINAVAPGPVDNPMGRSHRTAASLGRWQAATPMGRTARVDEVAGAVDFLLNDNAGFITGQVLCVDGGLTAAGPLGDPVGAGIERTADRGGIELCRQTVPLPEPVTSRSGRMETENAATARPK